MLFGRSLFGGALYPRQVTAGGVVAATSSARVVESANRKSGASAAASAVAAQASAVRVVIPTSPVVSCTSAATSTAKVNFSGFVDGHAASSVLGQARVDFTADAVALAVAGALPNPERRVRINFPSVAQGVALGEAEGAAWVYARLAAVAAKAFTFGTHWYVGRGWAVAAASVEATATQNLNAEGHATASATPTALAQLEAYGQGVAEPAQALLDSDPILESDGVLYRFGRSNVRAAAEPTATCYVYSVMLAVGFANVSAQAQARRAASGRTSGVALGVADTERVVPFEGAVVVGAAAHGSARAKASVLGRVRTNTRAEVAPANIVYIVSGSVNVDSQAGAVSTRVVIETAPGTAGGTALAAPAKAANAAVGRAQATTSGAAGTGAVVARFAAIGASGGHSLPSATAALHPKIPVSGTATAEAFCEGTNVVGFADQPLGARVIRVESALRTTTVQSSTRVVAVAGFNRQLAA